MRLKVQCLWFSNTVPFPAWCLAVADPGVSSKCLCTFIMLLCVFLSRLRLHSQRVGEKISEMVIFICRDNTNLCWVPAQTSQTAQMEWARFLRLLNMTWIFSLWFRPREWELKFMCETTRKWFRHREVRVTLHTVEFCWSSCIFSIITSQYCLHNSLLWWERGGAHHIFADSRSSLWIIIFLPSVQSQTTCGLCVHFSRPGECWTGKVYPYCVLCSCLYHNPGLICKSQSHYS